MMSRTSHKRSSRILIMYVISALLFLTSIELHIHTREAAYKADHGSSVSFSSLSSKLTHVSTGDEIKVSPDGVLKANQNIINLLAVFLLFAVISVLLCRSCIVRMRDRATLLPVFPFHGAPPLRGPPVNS